FFDRRSRRAGGGFSLTLQRPVSVSNLCEISALQQGGQRSSGDAGGFNDLDAGSGLSRTQKIDQFLLVHKEWDSRHFGHEAPFDRTWAARPRGILLFGLDRTN